MDNGGIEKMLIELATNEDISAGVAVALMQKLLQIDVKDKGEG